VQQRSYQNPNKKLGNQPPKLKNKYQIYKEANFIFAHNDLAHALSDDMAAHKASCDIKYYFVDIHSAFLVYEHNDS
jgi:hypothetical protein